MQDKRLSVAEKTPGTKPTLPFAGDRKVVIKYVVNIYINVVCCVGRVEIEIEI